jgi:hypothetical protein
MKRNTKRQGGYIYPRAGWWVLRYRDDVLEGGELVRKQLAKQLTPIKPEHARLKRAPADVEDMAEAFLRPLNSGETNPQSTQTIGQFVENYFSRGLSMRFGNALSPDIGADGDRN